MAGEAAVAPKANMHAVLFWVLLAVGMMLRVAGFPNLPAGLDVDEVSSSYESWSLLLTGAESWGNHLPVYFSQQGGGQNVLYSYLNIPFIALFGPTMVGARLLALLVGIGTLPLLYVTVRRWYGRTTALVAMGLTVIIPWQIMLSHWALESNLLPFTLLLTVYITTRAVQDGNRVCILLTGPLLALNCYAYGISCVPVSILTVFIIVFYHRDMRQHLGYWVLSGVLLLITLFPFLLLIGKIYLHLHYPFANTLPFSLPNLNRNRLADLQRFGGAPLPTSLDLIFLRGSNDYNPNSSLPFGSPFPSFIAWGAVGYVLFKICMYVRVGVRSRRFRLPTPTLPELWLMAVPAIWVLIPVIVRETNAFYLPAIIVFAALSVHVFNLIRKPFLRLLAAILIICCGIYLFIPALAVYYGGGYSDYASTAFKDITQPLKTVQGEAEHQPIYVNNGLGFNYVYTLWDLKVTPQQFRAAHPTYTNPDFENFVFETANIDTHKPYWYLVPNTATPHSYGLTCATTVHQQVIDVQWRIGQCLPAG